MVDKLQKEVISSLNLKEIYLFKTQCKFGQGFEPLYSPDANNLIAQYKFQATEISTIDFSEIDCNDTKNNQIFRVFMDLGVRLAPKSCVDEKNNEILDKDIKAIIESVFVAEYEMKKPVSEDALQSFASKHAIYHIWPYWVEYMHSTCLRMNLQKIEVPPIVLMQEEN